MTYARVIPRDLFNEGNLLTCLGRLWIKLDERRGHRAELCQNEDLGPFEIQQDPADGSIFTEAVELMLDGASIERLFRPLNARAKWPLWARVGDEDVRVFDEEGELSPEFRTLVAAVPEGDQEDDSYPGPCTNPGGHEWPRVEESERCLCIHCGADGDA